MHEILSQRSRGTVVGLGLCVMDHTYLLQRDEPGAERVRYVESLRAPGGMIGTALAQVAQLGVRAKVLSLVGDDDDGRAVRRRLRAFGVDTRRLLVSRTLPTTTAVVLVDRATGRRRFVVPDRRALERRAPAFDLTPIRRGAVLLIDGHFPAQALRAARLARAHGVPVVGDFHRPSPAVLRLLPFVDYPVVPREFAGLFTGGGIRDTLRRLRADYGATPVVTLGAEGGIWLDGSRFQRFRAPRVRVLDSTGAGDVFHGAFAAGLAQGVPLARNLARASRAGALACTALGGMSRLSKEADLEVGRRAASRRRAKAGSPSASD